MDFHPVGWLCFACFTVPCAVLIFKIVLWGVRKAKGDFDKTFPGSGE